MNNLERFTSKINKIPGGCWMWTGCTYKGSHYGAFWINGQNRPAHRISWQFLRPENPIGDKHVLHKCDIRGCVNPDHLFLGTELDNHQDKAAKGRSASGERNGGAKLTESQVLEIRRLYPSIKSMRKLAAQFHVAKFTIHRIVRHTGWKDLIW